MTGEFDVYIERDVRWPRPWHFHVDFLTRDDEGEIDVRYHGDHGYAFSFKGAHRKAYRVVRKMRAGGFG